MADSLSETEASTKSRRRIQLSPQQRETLARWLAGDDARLQKRAQIILLLADGESADAVSQALQVAVPTVHKWSRRFVKHGPAGLSDLPRSGQPPRLPKSLREEIVRITTQETPPHGGRWTIRTAARHLGVTQHQIRKLWSDAGVRPHAAERRSARADVEEHRDSPRQAARSS